jgi:NADP-dependent 3-hydroxy acid dehydrogenase YdfG
VEMHDLEGKTAVVTGASSGIGAGIAARLGAMRAYVHLVGRTVEPMNATKAAIERAGGKAEIVLLDVRDSAALVAVIDRAADDTGRLDVMVNNAGVSYPGPVLTGVLDQWREMIDVNLVATLVGTQTAVRAMRRCRSGGHVINISSTDASVSESGVYGATKIAVNHITRTVRRELEDDDIRISAISPGPVATNVVRNFDPAVLSGLVALSGVEAEVEAGSRLPDDILARAQVELAQLVATPDDIAEAVVYVLRQPRRLNVAELVVRPAKTLVL